MQSMCEYVMWIGAKSSIHFAQAVYYICTVFMYKKNEAQENRLYSSHA